MSLSVSICGSQQLLLFSSRQAAQELTSNPWRNRRCVKCRMVLYIKVPMGQRCSATEPQIQVSKEATGHKIAMAPFSACLPSGGLSTSATPGAPENVPAPVCSGCDLQERTNRRVIPFLAQNVSQVLFVSQSDNPAASSKVQKK